MSPSLSRLRSQVESLRHPTHPRATRYGPELRRSVALVARRECRRGRSVAGVARALGLPAQTVATWLGASRPARLRPVEIAPASEPATASVGLVVTIGALRVEGLDLAGVVVLVRAMS